MTRTTINGNVMHISRSVGAMFPVCKNLRAVYCVRIDDFRDAADMKCKKCQSTFEKWEARKAAKAT